LFGDYCEHGKEIMVKMPEHRKNEDNRVVALKQKSDNQKKQKSTRMFSEIAGSFCSVS